MAVQNPLTSLDDDVATTRRLLALQDGPTILVGHSYAGFVITEAGNAPNVAGLVYISSYGPDEGESHDDLVKRFPRLLESGRSTWMKTDFSGSHATSFTKLSCTTSRHLTPASLLLSKNLRQRRLFWRTGDFPSVEVEAVLVSCLDRRSSDQSRSAALHGEAIGRYPEDGPVQSCVLDFSSSRGRQSYS